MNSEQFWKLLEPVHAQAAAFCFRLTGDYDRGCDLYQDGLLSALRRFDSLRDKTAFRAWLFRILINCHRNRCRSLWRKLRRPSTPEMIESSIKFDPRRNFTLRRRLSRVLAALAAEDQALIVLYEVEGYTVRELAEIFCRPEGTIKIRLARARRKLRKRLERQLSKSQSGMNFGEAFYALQRSETVDR